MTQFTSAALPSPGAFVRRAFVVLAMIAVAACSSTAARASVPAGSPVVVADQLAFAASEVAVPAGRPFVLAFDNREGQPHNVTILDAGGRQLFTGEVFSGPAVRAYDVPALPAGRLTFRCDVHPTMTGTLVAGS
jgi:plastocyanin